MVSISLKLRLIYPSLLETEIKRKAMKLLLIHYALWKFVYALWEVVEIFQKRPRVWDFSWYSQVSSSVTDKHIKSRSNTI